ncbi:MAG: hypothetical protein HC890_17890 [Chloroflexaceae bacterium]|nr:hypothetical protein [Chloroflexaceae bacterium]
MVFGAGLCLGETWRTPPLILTTVDGNWSIHRRWDGDKITRSTRHQEGVTGGGTETVEVGPYERGVWTDWVFQVKWAYDDQGQLKVWQNGQLVADRQGPNTFRDFIMPYFKIGIYKPQWTSNPARSHLDERTLYIDAIRIGNGQATYEDVAP